jgi:hypothetical protein
VTSTGWGTRLVALFAPLIESACALPGREARPCSLAYLVHITDPQNTDEVSPARVGFGFLGTRRTHDFFPMLVLD